MKQLLAICLLLAATQATAQNITAFEDKASGKIGFKQDGVVILPATLYEEWEGFSEGLIAVSKKNKWGFIDLKGKEVIGFDYFSVSTFHEGYALVALKRGKYGYIDKAGNKVTEFIYQFGRPFHDGFAAVELKDKYGFIDAKGVVVVPCKYQLAYGFNEGMASVRLNDKWGFVDQNGTEVVACKYDGADFFVGGFAAVAIGEKYTFIDKTGKEIIAPVYDYIGHFSSGLAKVKINSYYGFIDGTGKEVIKPTYTGATDFKGGFARLIFQDNHYANRCIYIDKTGAPISDKNYDAYASDDFSNGLAIVEALCGGCGGKGVIDRTGKEIIAPKYTRISYNAGVFTAVDGNGASFRFDESGNPIK
jgi:hypothetical protein